LHQGAGSGALGLIDGLKDDFVIRGKSSRNDEDQKTKLIDKEFKHSKTFNVEKFSCKRKVYQNASILIECGSFKDYVVVRITAKQRDGSNIFKAPMLLFTNKQVSCEDEAFLIYKIYMKRSRIETVFKFLKEGMGWESIQLRDFEAIKNLLSISFFLASYLYEVGAQECHDDFVILLAELGGGKDKVTRHFIFKGIQTLLAKHRVDRILENHKPSPETLKKMNDMCEIEFF
jgi:hypothetical protein